MAVRVAWLVIAACGGIDPQGQPPGSTPSPEPPGSDEPPVAIEVQLTVPAAFDPLQASLPITVTAAEGAEVTVRAVKDGIEQATWSGPAAGGTFAAAWDGKDGTGAWATAGKVDILATATGDAGSAESSAAAFVVRAAFDEVRLTDDDGVSSLRIPLYWAGDQEIQDEAEAVAVLAEVDDGTVPLDFPAVDLSSLVARPATAEPAAYRQADTPILELVPALVSQAIGATGIDLVDVTVTAEGWIDVVGAPLTAGEPVVFLRASPLPASLGVTAEEVVFTFWAGGTEIGTQRLPLHLYRLLDESQFDSPGPRYEPWVAVVDPALTAIEGTAPETDAVLDALVDFVYLDLALEYDTVAGASFYSTYQTGFFDGPHFFLSDFLARKDGNVVNCSDAANILGAYANMVGARLEHLIIEPGFDLNYIQAIGYSDFVSCPFGPGFCGFSYHAVTTYPDAFHIWDATLALDGDTDPGTAPHTELLVQTIDAAEYLDRLVRAGFTEYGHQAQETLE